MKCYLKVCFSGEFFIQAGILSTLIDDIEGTSPRLNSVHVHSHELIQMSV
jgi:hypothetical protein